MDVSRSRPYRFDRFLAVPLIGPVLLLAAGNANFMFDGPGWIDAFGMVGRFWHYADHNPRFEEYQGSRLPWILPGFVLHHLFNAATASYILHTTNLVASSLAVYLIVRDTLCDRPVAAVTAAAWATYPAIHGSGGWNYHVAAAATYYLWGVWMLARSTGSAHRKAWLLGSGAMLVSAVHTHTVFAGFLPIAALLYIPTLLDRDRQRWRAGAAVAGYASAGALGATLILGAIDKITGGRWLFFLPQVEYTLRFVGVGNRWFVQAADWMPTASYLVIPCLALIATVPWLVAVARRRAFTTIESRLALVLVTQHVLAFALMSYLQFGGRQTALDHPHFAFPLYCHTFPAIGALLWSTRSGRHRAGLPFTIAMAIVLTAPLVLLLPAWLPQHLLAMTHALHLPDAPPVFAPLAVGIAVLPLGLLSGRLRLAAFALGFGLFSAWLTSPAAYGIRTPGINRDMLAVFRSLDRFATELDPSLFAIRFWGEPGIVRIAGEPTDMAAVFRSWLAIRRRSLVTAAYDRPDARADDLTANDLYDATCLGILSTPDVHQDVVNRLTRRFREAGVRLRPLAHQQAESGSFSIALTVLTTGPANDPRPAVRPCRPLP